MSDGIIVGFTGTRAGMSAAQREAVEHFLRTWNVAAFVHGDCVGADDEADAIAVALSIPRVLRPCTIESMRAHGERRGGHILELHAPEAPLVRNAKIVRGSDAMLAAPRGPEVLRSGTWSTIRQARKAKKNLVIIYPSGQAGS